MQRLVILLLALGLMGLASATHADDIRSERIRFPQGEIGTTIEGSIRGYEGVDYKLNARAGQVMTARLETDNPSNYFNVLAPGEADVAFFIGSAEGKRFEGELPEGGDYSIRLYLMRNAARRDEQANYSLEVAIAAAGDAPSAASSSQAARSDSIGPGFDCAKAIHEVEQLICKDAGLAELDRSLTDLYTILLEHTPAGEQKMLKAEQRGWVKGRNECWKSNDMRGCVESGYRARIDELEDR